MDQPAAYELDRQSHSRFQEGRKGADDRIGDLHLFVILRTHEATLAAVRVKEFECPSFDGIILKLQFRAEAVLPKGRRVDVLESSMHDAAHLALSRVVIGGDYTINVVLVRNRHSRP